MFKQEYIDRINARLIEVHKQTKTLFADGNEDEILCFVEEQRRVYLYLKEKASEVATKRKLTKLKSYAKQKSKASPDLGLEKQAPATRGRKAQTKDERLEEIAGNLGLDAGEFLKKLKEK